MSEDTKSGTSPVGSIKLGDIKIPVVDSHGVQTVAVDLMTEGREFNGICAFSFATMVVTPNADGQNTLQAVICARLRFTLPVAIDLRNMLENLLKKAMPPKGETH